MENASKALLIAAAVLIVVLLIVFGVRVFNTSSDAGDAGEAASSIKSGITNASTQTNSLITESLKK